MYLPCVTIGISHKEVAHSANESYMYKIISNNDRIGTQNKGFLSLLERLLSASESGNLDITLDESNLTQEEEKAVQLINEILRNYKATTDYELMKYRLTSDALGIALWDMEIVDGDPIGPNNRFTWSQEFRSMLGFKGEYDFPDILHSWSDRLHPDDKDIVLKAFAAHIMDTTGQTPYDIEYRLKLKNGEYRYFQAFGTTLRDTSGAGIRVAGALVDVTEKVQMAQEVTDALIDAQQANRVKSDFLSRMNHEMLTPMNHIMGISQIAKRQCESQSFSEHIIKIEDASRNLLRMIHGLLDISGKGRGLFEFTESVFSFDSVIHYLLSRIQNKADKKKQMFAYEIDKSVPKTIIGDEKRVTQVIVHLVENAVKYTPDGGKIHLSIRMKNNIHNFITLKIIVTDNGIGIPKDKQNNIFDVFEQIDGSLTRKYDGSGIGLPLSKRIVEMMGGKLWVESEPGKGSKFIFTCILKKDEEALDT